MNIVQTEHETPVLNPKQLKVGHTYVNLHNSSELFMQTSAGLLSLLSGNICMPGGATRFQEITITGRWTLAKVEVL